MRTRLKWSRVKYNHYRTVVTDIVNNIQYTLIATSSGLYVTSSASTSTSQLPARSLRDAKKQARKLLESLGVRFGSEIRRRTRRTYP